MHFAVVGDRVGEDRRFLRAGDGDVAAGSGQAAKTIELGATELTAGRHLGALAVRAQRIRIERDRILTRTNDDLARLIRHYFSGSGHNSRPFRGTGCGGPYAIIVPM